MRYKILIAAALLLGTAGCFSTNYTYHTDGRVTKTVYWGTYTGDRTELYQTEEVPEETTSVAVPPPTAE